MSGIFDQVINYAPPSLLKGTVTYKGTWSAATNTPTLINPPDSTTNGFYYVVSAGGTQFSLVFNIGDWIISNGSAWEKVDNTDAVSSVFGRTGAVVGVSTDYSSVGITATAVGASSPSTGAFTTLSATTPLAAASGGTGLSSLGTGVATFLGTPTSANLAAAVTNETGSGSLVFGTSPTITTPVIAQINDANGNETLKLASIASAVNEVTIENAATGNAVHILATGGDASVGLHLAGKGASGYVNVQDSTDATKRIMFNAAGGTTNTRTMLSSTQTVDRTLSLPDATDTLVGKATTDTLTNKTLTSPTITGGALNGTLGATTPSSVAATTGTFSSTLGVTGVATLGNGAILGTPASGTVTNLTGTASININGTVGATTPSTVAATTISATGATINTTTGQSLLTLSDGGVGSYSRLNMRGGGSNLAWSLGAQDITTNALTITPSTTNGGTTFTTPIATFTSTGLNSTAIGATTPAAGSFTTLSSAVAGNNYLTINGSAAGNEAGIVLQRAGSYKWYIANDASDGLYFYTAGVEVMRMGAGSVAVTGTLSATSSLTMSGGTLSLTSTSSYIYLNSRITGTNNGQLLFNNGTGNNFALNETASSVYSFGTSTAGGALSLNVLSMNVSSGNVGIGTTSPSGKLTVVCATTPILSTFTSTLGGYDSYSTDDASGARFFTCFNSGGSVIGSISRVTTTNAVAFNTTSDGRLKENFRDFTDSGRLIDALKPRVFDWKNSDDNGKGVIGFIAQEEHAADPIFAHIGAVSVGDDDPDTITKQWQRSDAALIPILVAELQSLRKRLAALESK